MPKARRSKFRFLKWATGLLLILAVMMLSVSPDTPPPNPPNASQLQRLKSVASQLRDHAGQPKPHEVSLAWEDIQGAGALAARTLGIERVQAFGDSDGAEFRASVPIKFGLWTNVRGYVAPNPDGFPAISGRIGWLPIPGFMVRFGIYLTERWLIWRGVDAPMPDGVLHEISFDKRGAFARVRLPKDSRLYRTLNEARSSPVDTNQVIASYCRLAEMQRSAPATDLVTHVRRAFSEASDAEANKAALVALAMIVVQPEVGTIAGSVRDGIADCRIGDQGITLLDRQDLAKHWTLSAALTAALGAGVSEAMGTWKEVADSGPGGTGFSFVDLAADRSGVEMGQKATDPNHAEATSTTLRTVSEHALLPIQALALSEGLSATEFEQRFVDIDSADYAAMVARIDRVLAEN